MTCCKGPGNAMERKKKQGKKRVGKRFSVSFRAVTQGAFKIIDWDEVLIQGIL